MERTLSAMVHLVTESRSLWSASEVLQQCWLWISWPGVLVPALSCWLEEPGYWVTEGGETGKPSRCECFIANLICKSDVYLGGSWEFPALDYHLTKLSHVFSLILHSS